MSAWFINARAYIEPLGVAWFILSAKYGLVTPQEILNPYEETLNNTPREKRCTWAQRVIGQMESILPQADSVTVFAGMRYREFLMDYLSHRFQKLDVPLEGLRIGEQLRWLIRHRL